MTVLDFHDIASDTRVDEPCPEHARFSPRPDVAVVSDRGLRRQRNEDAGAVASDGSWFGLVVCDGVGSTPDSHRAASAASRAARAALAGARDTGYDLVAQLSQAVQAGAAAAEACGAHAAGNSAPATTLVAAVTDGRSIAAASVGDSRVYWVPDDGVAELLTTDDSYAAAQRALGARAEDTERSPFAHVITRWLGAGSPRVEVRVTVTSVNRPGWLIACSDGLWGYLPPAWGMAGVAEPDGHEDGMTVAERLVDWANRMGGRDNITVALARVEPVALARVEPVALARAEAVAHEAVRGAA